MESKFSTAPSEYLSKSERKDDSKGREAYLRPKLPTYLPTSSCLVGQAPIVLKGLIIDAAEFYF